MTQLCQQKKRTRRTPEQQIADLQVEIERIKQRAAERVARKDPALRHVRAAVRAVDKAQADCEDAVTSKALGDARATLAACLSLNGAVPSTGRVVAVVEADDVMRYVEQHPGCKAEEIASALGADTKAVGRVLKRLREDGRVRSEGKARGMRYYRA